MLCSRHRCSHRRLFVCWVPACRACVLVVAGVPAVNGVPVVADILAAAGFPALPSDAGFPAVLGVYDNLASILFTGVLAVAEVLPLSGVHAVVVDHAVYGIPAVAGSLLLQLSMHIIE